MTIGSLKAAIANCFADLTSRGYRVFKGLLKNQSSEQEIKTEAVEEPVASVPTAEAPASATYPRDGRKRSNRGRLLGSLKPYLSEKRASAIDTMISVADILDAMKGG